MKMIKCFPLFIYLLCLTMEAFDNLATVFFLGEKYFSPPCIKMLRAFLVPSSLTFFVSMAVSFFMSSPSEFSATKLIFLDVDSSNVY